MSAGIRDGKAAGPHTNSFFLQRFTARAEREWTNKEPLRSKMLHCQVPKSSGLRRQELTRQLGAKSPGAVTARQPHGIPRGTEMDLKVRDQTDPQYSSSTAG